MEGLRVSRGCCQGQEQELRFAWAQASSAIANRQTHTESRRPEPNALVMPHRAMYKWCHPSLARSREQPAPSPRSEVLAAGGRVPSSREAGTGRGLGSRCSCGKRGVSDCSLGGAAPLALTLIQEKGHARGPPCLSDRSPCPGCRDPLSSQALQGVWRRGLESAPSTAQDLSFTGAPCPRRSRRAGNSRPSRVGRCSHTLAPGCHQGAAGQAQMSRLVASSAKPLAVQVPSPRRERQRLQRCHGGHTS